MTTYTTLGKLDYAAVDPDARYSLTTPGSKAPYVTLNGEAVIRYAARRAATQPNDVVRRIDSNAPVR